MSASRRLECWKIVGVGLANGSHHQRAIQRYMTLVGFFCWLRSNSSYWYQQTVDFRSRLDIIVGCSGGSWELQHRRHFCLEALTVCEGHHEADLSLRDGSTGASCILLAEFDTNALEKSWKRRV
jgi:hypothetical protein